VNQAIVFCLLVILVALLLSALDFVGVRDLGWGPA